MVAKAIRRNKLLEFFASLPPCLVGLEASGSAHHWAREHIKLGHDARMMPPAYVRERFSCRECETITQPPAPFHVTPRGFAGPNLLAMILFEKFGQHQPLNRQSERYAREGVDLSLSTLADQVGACAAALRPLHTLIERHVLSAERLHGDDSVLRKHAERMICMV